MKIRAVVIWVVVVLAVLLAPVAANWASITIAERRCAAVQADAKRLGVPLDPQSALVDYQPGPDQDNAAEGVKTVLRKLLKVPPRKVLDEFQPSMKDEFKEPATEISDELKKGSQANLHRLAKLLQPFEPYLDDLTSAIDRPSWNCKRRWEEGIAILLPDLMHYRTHKPGSCRQGQGQLEDRPR